MATIILETRINAPIEICFNLARNIVVHQLSTVQTREKAVAGRINGLIELGETVTWEAVHFGIKQRLTVKITQLEFPYLFVDEMTSGAFKTMKHIHLFAPTEVGTLMTDEFSYTTPLSVLGRLFDVLILKRYMTAFLHKRNELLKQFAESAAQQA
jgi:ligand-binding SRPBCC domain-containing protein